MEKIGDILEKKRREVVREKNNRRPATKEQFLADQIWTHLGKHVAFPRIMRIIKEKGYQAVYEIFNEVRSSNPRNRASLFLWKAKNERIVWKEENKKAPTPCGLSTAPKGSTPRSTLC